MTWISASGDPVMGGRPCLPPGSAKCQTDVVFATVISKAILNGKIPFWGIFGKNSAEVIVIKIAFFIH